MKTTLSPISKSKKLCTAFLFTSILGAPLTGCGSTDQTNSGGNFSNFGPPALRILAGDGQVGLPAAQLVTPLTVQVADNQGHVLPGYTVAFTVTGGGGSLTQSQVVGDGSGTASTFLKLGAAGPNTVTASVVGLGVAPLVFTETAVAPPATFSGVGKATGAATASNAFKTAIGGVDNGGTATPFNSGFRVINWDAVTLAGLDFGGNSTVIVLNRTVGIPTNRFQSRGVNFAEVYAVSGDAFVSTNAVGLTGQFVPFSLNNVFAMFNDNQLELNFVTPSAPPAAQVNGAVRGFGSIFIDVETANASSIEYFNGPNSLGKFFVSTGPSGESEFLGVLYNTPVVTNVQLTLGNGNIFSFNGGVVTPGVKDITIDPIGGSDAVVTDDFIYSEPNH